MFSGSSLGSPLHISLYFLLFYPHYKLILFCRSFIKNVLINFFRNNPKNAQNWNFLRHWPWKEIFHICWNYLTATKSKFYKFSWVFFIQTFPTDSKNKIYYFCMILCTNILERFWIACCIYFLSWIFKNRMPLK